MEFSDTAHWLQLLPDKSEFVHASDDSISSDEQENKAGANLAAALAADTGCLCILQKDEDILDTVTPASFIFTYD